MFGSLGAGVEEITAKHRLFQQFLLLAGLVHWRAVKGQCDRNLNKIRVGLHHKFLGEENVLPRLPRKADHKISPEL